MSTRHLDYIDGLNVLACFGVVVLHCNCFWDGPSIGRAWITADFIESLFYWAAPVFFMISGVTLMDYRARMSTREYFSRRLKKTFVPYLLWTCVALAYGYAKGAVQTPIVHAFFSELIAPSIIDIYWFFPALFGLYLCIPVISAVQPRREIFRYILLVGFVFQAVDPLVLQVLSLPALGSAMPAVASGYLFYAVLGYELANTELTNRQRLCIYLLGIGGFAVQFLGTWALSTDGAICMLFKGYFNFPCVFQASAAFVGVKQLYEERLQAAPRFVTELSRTTFGIYLMHRYLTFHVPGLLGITNRPILWRTLGGGWGLPRMCGGRQAHADGQAAQAVLGAIELGVPEGLERWASLARPEWQRPRP